MSGTGGMDTVRVPASEIIHLFRPLRPGQIRGEPWLARALVKLNELDQYDDAELVRKKTAAMFAGFITRLAPELLKWLDRKGERGHELAMQDKALEFEKLRGAQRMDEIGASADAAWNVGAIETLREAVRTQGEKTGVRWADALSSSVRPVITYWFMALYCTAKTAAFVAAIEGGADWGVAILHAWTEADQALWAGVLNFWFLGRVFDRVRP